eukprot:10007455-Prorocentrum_lima.AAC.1
MTSSLVGSEMCIRDRVSNCPQVLRRVVVPCCNLQRADLVSCRMLSDGAVSYTHLTLPTICSV